MARLVRFRVLDGIAVVTLDAPPVNALSGPLRAGLWEVLTRVDANDDIKAAVILGAGSMFAAGADIREFDGPDHKPSLPQLCDRIESCTKPVVVALHGQALGGGAERALQVIISASTVDMLTAQRIGLIDGVVQGDLASGAIAFAQNLIVQGKVVRPTRVNRTHLKDARAHQTAIKTARTTLADNPLHAPQRVIDCVEASALLPFDAGLAFEADAFARCLGHLQSVALRHVFMAERKIDTALIERDGASFRPVEPMGKSTVQRLRKAMRTAAGVLVEGGAKAEDIDGALIAYGFRKRAVWRQDPRRTQRYNRAPNDCCPCGGRVSLRRRKRRTAPVRHRCACRSWPGIPAQKRWPDARRAHDGFDRAAQRYAHLGARPRHLGGARVAG
ncbi:enoyl-CoA hydratase-related protein [Octadecabacter sp.]|nr:enoyl-CoA hydratase-related protein [Octadecabacter sp.]